MNKNILTELLHEADRKMVQEAVAHLQEKFAFRNAELLRLKTEKDQLEKKYQDVIQEHRASNYKLNNEVSELKKEIQKYQKSEQALNTELSALKREVCRKEELLNQKTKESVLYRKFTIDKRNCFTLNKKNVHLGD